MNASKIRRVLATAALFGTAFALACACSMLGAEEAQAIYHERSVTAFDSNTHYVVLDPTNPLRENDPSPNEWSIYDAAGAKKIKKIKSSNSKVAKIKHVSKNGFDILMKKAGKATVTYTYKGKKYTHKFVVLKYKNPAKTLKIGKKNYASKFKKNGRYDITSSQAGKKLTVKAISGWRVESVVVTTSNSEKRKKSGYKIAKADKDITVVWEHKKNHAIIATTIRLLEGKVFCLSYGASKGGSMTSSANVKTMYKAFCGMQLPDYKLSKSNVVKKDYKAFKTATFKKVVKSTLKKATASDLCFIFINAHGKAQMDGQDEKKYPLYYPGVVTGDEWGEYYSWSDMLAYLGKHIKGKIILLPEMCFSGNFVNAAKSCSAKKRIAVLSAANTNTGASQLALWFFGKGNYTKALSKGLGYKTDRLAADSNNNFQVTLGELFSYIKKNKDVKGQHPMSYFGGSLKKLVLYEE